MADAFGFDAEAVQFEVVLVGEVGDDVTDLGGGLSAAYGSEADGGVFSEVDAVVGVHLDALVVVVDVPTLDDGNDEVSEVFV